MYCFCQYKFTCTWYVVHLTLNSRSTTLALSVDLFLINHVNLIQMDVWFDNKVKKQPFSVWPYFALVIKCVGNFSHLFSRIWYHQTLTEFSMKCVITYSYQELWSTTIKRMKIFFFRRIFDSSAESKILRKNRRGCFLMTRFSCMSMERRWIINYWSNIYLFPSCLFLDHSRYLSPVMNKLK